MSSALGFEGWKKNWGKLSPVVYKGFNEMSSIPPSISPQPITRWKQAYKDNPERVKENNRRYYHAVPPEKRREIRAAKYQKERERAKRELQEREEGLREFTTTQLYYKKNAKKIRSYAFDYYRKNRERYKANKEAKLKKEEPLLSDWIPPGFNDAFPPSTEETFSLGKQSPETDHPRLLMDS